MLCFMYRQDKQALEKEKKSGDIPDFEIHTYGHHHFFSSPNVHSRTMRSFFSLNYYPMHPEILPCKQNVLRV